MDEQVETTKYFYVVHIFVYHSITLQKVISLAKIFTDSDSESTVLTTDLNDGFFVLVVQSSKLINKNAISTFESFTSRIDGVEMIFSHATIDLEKINDNYPPTFVYSAFYALNFSRLNYRIGEGLTFRIKLKKLLYQINKDGNYLNFFPTELGLIIESTEKFKDSDLAKLSMLLQNKRVEKLTSFSNFPSNL